MLKRVSNVGKKHRRDAGDARDRSASTIWIRRRETTNAGQKVRQREPPFMKAAVSFSAEIESLVKPVFSPPVGASDSSDGRGPSTVPGATPALISGSRGRSAGSANMDR